MDNIQSATENLIEAVRESQIDLFEAVDHFESKYRDLRRIPEVNAFLEAELSLCKRIQKVQDDLFEAVHISIPEV